MAKTKTAKKTVKKTVKKTAKKTVKKTRKPKVKDLKCKKCGYESCFVGQDFWNTRPGEVKAARMGALESVRKRIKAEILLIGWEPSDEMDLSEVIDTVIDNLEGKP